MIIAKCYSQQGQGDMFFSNDEGAGLTTHERSSERQIVKQKNRRVEHGSTEGTVTDSTNQ